MSIVAQKITYIHPDNQVLFKGIDLTINKGQKVALVGNNGSGKSTFLRILAGTLQAQEGEISYPTPPYYVPQHFGQYDNQTVAQALRIDGKLEALRCKDSTINVSHVGFILICRAKFLQNPVLQNYLHTSNQ